MAGRMTRSPKSSGTRRRQTAKSSKPRVEATIAKKGRSRSSATTPEQLLRTRVAKLESLLDIAKAMTAERDLDTLLRLILSAAVRVVDADRCTLWIVDRERRELWSKVAQGLADGARIRVPFGVGICGQVAATGLVINIPDAYADESFNAKVSSILVAFWICSVILSR
jgi:putative methionine-R-sulfoxide reductase with GAF domain